LIVGDVYGVATISRLLKMIGLFAEFSRVRSTQKNELYGEHVYSMHTKLASDFAPPLAFSSKIVLKRNIET